MLLPTTVVAQLPPSPLQAQAAQVQAQGSPTVNHSEDRIHQIKFPQGHSIKTRVQLFLTNSAEVDHG